MNHYKKIEHYLYHYKMFKCYLETTDKEILMLSENDGMKGIAYDGISTSNTNMTSDRVGDVAISNLDRLKELQDKKHKLQKKIDVIDRVLSELTEIERTIIEMKYFECKPWCKIAYEVKYSERQCRNIRKAAIDKISIGLYGEE